VAIKMLLVRAMLDGALEQREDAYRQRARLGRLPVAAALHEEARRQTEGRLSGFTFDAGALIALERNDRRVLQIIGRVVEVGMRMTVPATALAQVMRSPARQWRLSRLIHDVRTDVISLDGAGATAVGVLLASTRTSDIVDACSRSARRAGQPVLTSDAGDLRRLDPHCA
jgi:hypothetical protein